MVQNDFRSICIVLLRPLSQGRHSLSARRSGLHVSSSNREDLGRTLGWEAILCGGGDGSCRDLVPLHACLNSPPRFPIFKWYSPRVSWACANKRTTIPDCLVGTSAEFLPSDLVLQQLVSDPFLRKVRDANSLGGGIAGVTFWVLCIYGSI